VFGVEYLVNVILAFSGPGSAPFVPSHQESPHNLLKRHRHPVVGVCSTEMNFVRNWGMDRSLFARAVGYTTRRKTGKKHHQDCGQTAPKTTRCTALF
jgi:hypothetical protein